MTAEASVLNRVGVALAADSAVTIGSPGSAKIYTSAEKLFQLSNTAPVGVMIYGNAGYLGIPWETLIKVFRERITGRTFDTVQEYAEAFFDFLCSDTDLFPKDLQDAHTEEIVAYLFLLIRHFLAKQLDREAEEANGLDDADVARIADSVVKKMLKEIKSRDRLGDLSSRPVSDTRERYGDMLREVREQVFGRLPLTPVTKRRLFEAAVQVITRAFFGPAHAGVVFAGFGDREYLPVLIAYQVEHAALDRPRRFKQFEERIDHKTTGAVHAFAQGEMVHAFMEGINPGIQLFLMTSTSAMMRNVVSLLIAKVEEADPQIAAELTTFMRGEMAGLFDELFESWEERRSRVWRPIVRMVSSLPKDELASMAEALVNLTKFRRRVTPDQETVGGPVDVAIMTKGDGFVWVRRKHYFEPELNPRAMARYLRG